MTGYNWDPELIWIYRDAFLLGARLTIELTLICIVGGTLLGIGIALARMSGNAPMRWLMAAIIELLRAIPLLVLLVWLYFCLPILTGATVSGYVAAALGLSLNLAPFAAETFRAGIEAVPPGAEDAARSLGMTKAQAMRHVVLPQAFRQMLPPFVGLWITMLKLTSLASVIAVPELLHKSNEIISVTFHPLEVYSAVALAYMVIVLPLSLIAQRFETSRLLNRIAVER